MRHVFSINPFGCLVNLARILFFVLVFCIYNRLFAQDIFPPPAQKNKLRAYPIQDKIVLDGKLNERVWQLAPIATHFIQAEPFQGKPSRSKTEVRLLYDKKYLYVGAYMHDSLGLKGLRAASLRRDIDYGTSDIFGIVIDGFLDERNAMSFQVTPWGSLRDLMSSDGGNNSDRDWDAYWAARTTRTDSGWVAEMRIPFNNLRYPRHPHGKQISNDLDLDSSRTDVASLNSSNINAIDTTKRMALDDSTKGITATNGINWGVNFFRLHRRINEESAWSAYPRAYGTYRMQYAGLLTHIKPPPPGINLRLVPYFITEENSTTTDGKLSAYQLKPRIGGEVKWAISPKDVLDVTFNTDFAQADVDRQVVNLTRFSVFFPERRQFFLENARLFRSSFDGFLEPFFSRRIGLDDNGNIIPIDAGARFTSRHKKYNIGLMAVRQRSALGNPATNFTVGRVQINIGEQSRIGILASSKFSEPDSVGFANLSNTFTFDGLLRANQKVQFSYLISATTTRLNPKAGLAAGATVSKNTNQYDWAIALVGAAPDYDPQMGFIARTNFINPFLTAGLSYRPEWRPSFVRAFEPRVNADIYWVQTDGTFQEGLIWISPINIRFQSDAYFGMGVAPSLETVTNAFTPVGLTIPVGKYTFYNYQIYYNTDPSKKLFVNLGAQTGGYYGGQLHFGRASVRYSPIPHVSVTVTYNINALANIGENKEGKTTHLLVPEIRLAYNPRIQFSASYQYNSLDEVKRLNARISWEFLPLSFVYLVYNNFSFDQFNNTLNVNERIANQQTVFKVTFLKQF